MKTKLFALGATLVLAAGVTVAQPTITQSLILAGSNTTHRLTLTVPTLTGSRTVTIPDVSTNAFAMLTEGAQTANGALTLTAPLTLSGTSEIRFNNGANTFYSSFKAAAGQGANITYTLPATAPSAGQVLTAGTSNPTELTWSNPTSGGGGGSNVQFVVDGTDNTSDGNSNWDDINDMAVTLEAGKSYILTTYYRLARVGNNTANMEIGWTRSSNSVNMDWYYSVVTNDDVNEDDNTGDFDEGSTPIISLSSNTMVIEIRGLVVNTSGTSQTIRPRFRRVNGSNGNQVRMLSGSLIKVETSN
ncbi:MAG TPA: hypothetical protein PLW14_12065 [Chlorobiota bacterium]|nr:hypothetical protein [Chlorobiota bacterium]